MLYVRVKGSKPEIYKFLAFLEKGYTTINPSKIKVSDRENGLQHLFVDLEPKEAT